MKKTGVTLIELIVVVIIIGVLGTLGISHYGAFREKALDKEAQANLRLIIAAERIFKMESDTNTFCIANCNVTAPINDNLRLNLDESNTSNWIYYVATDPVGGGICVFCYRRLANGALGRAWSLNDVAAPNSVPFPTAVCH